MKRLLDISPGFFRLFLALIVMVYHTVDFLTIGHAAVYIFFVLSGYWIFKMYHEKYTNYVNSYRTYLRSRLLRIYPMYWSILLFSIVISSVYWKNIKGNIFYWSEGNIGSTIINNIVLLFRGIRKDFLYIHTAWSLDIELQFYVLAPLLIFFYKSKTSMYLALLVSSAAVLLSLAFNTVFTSYETVFLFLPFFLFGGVIYFSQYKSSYKQAMWSVVSIIGILAIHYIFPGLRAFLLDKNSKFLFFDSMYKDGINVIIALLSIPFIAYNIRQPLYNKERDGLMSSMSYVIYLLHWPLISVYATCARGFGVVPKAAMLLLYYVITLLLSYLISKYLDTFFEYKRRSWLSKVAKKAV